ncbi:MAG: ABC transporter permease subunit [Mesorhizobium sp.]|uniref:ABC transporter permease n=1 Tax=unclassified Mesorhizobium TaxID=325217 RepID=UPI000F75307B|nr:MULTISPECIES: ABC transporter permease [unclassified Mesorhizobium]AZO33605.1 ABC transporter permease [Mesorhizobium sp. M2A.F.Ca.ET.046.03.2.1]RVC80746.1 ABC transporter permease subunit [Mesorhizobium sp. M2A.F.Ca.ET.046.02.1.1]RWB38743.1 MAG: ABC transporter permease subunit [Mesorhizobium sp.]RWE22195.1 MAG: ABC transporter permease subunit [Mesorhizobium sp.]
MGFKLVTDIVRYLPILILLAAWEAVARSGAFSSDLFPPLFKIGQSWLEMVASGELTSNAAVSLYRVAIGLLSATAVGVLLGVGMAVWAPLRLIVSPFLELFYPIPKVALIPIAAIWLGFGDGSKILVVFLGCILPITLSAYNGARGTDQFLIWSARSMSASWPRVIRDVIVPSSLGEILNGIRTALALSFMLVVGSELLVARDGFGCLISFLGGTGAYSAMFAVALTVAILGFAADRIFLAITARALRWQTA